MSGDNSVIEIKQLSKSYRTRLAVDRLNLNVEPGELFGFVGPNGAGKTSTIRMVATLLEPDSGEIRVFGHSTRENPREVRRAIGYMPDFFGVYQDMRVWEYLDFFAACFRISEKRRLTLINDLLELVELSHRRADMVEALSRGMKQRLSLARTLIHDPQVLILDEPASGLDPRARVEIRELLVELVRMGKTIFFSTHILSDVAEICSRVGIIEAGKLVAVGPLEELRRRLVPSRQIHLAIIGNENKAQSILESFPGVISVRHLERIPTQGRFEVEISFMGDDLTLGEMLSSLIHQGVPVVNFSEESRDLEEVFLRLTQGLVT